MAYQQKLRLPDGQELALYNEGNTSQGSIRMDGESLTITGGGHSNVAISAGADLVFMGSAATIGGTSSILSLGNSGDTVSLNVPGVTYNIGTVTGNTTFANDLTVSGVFKPATITGTVVVTDATLSWSRDTDYATLSFVDYGADNDQLTLDVGDRQTDFFRIRGANATGTLANVVDFSQAGITSYVGVTATSFTEGSTTLSAKYLGISATAVDSSKLGGVVAASYLRNDQAGTISGALTVNGALTVGANNVVGSAAGYYLSLNGTATLSSLGNIIIQADSDNSSTTEYLSLKAGTDELKVDSGGNITFNANKVWHAGNDGTGSGLDADMVDGIEASRIVYGDNTTGTASLGDLNLLWKSGFYNGNNMANAPTASGWYWVANLAHSGNNTNYRYNGQIAFGNNMSGTPQMYIRSTGGDASAAPSTFNTTSWGKVWHDQNDGSGSGLDSDTVDGVHLSSLMRTDANTSTTGTITIGTGVTSVLTNQTDGSLRIGSTNGYIDIGPKNVSYAHIYTDRPSFYFNQDLLVNGNTVWHAGNDGTTSGLDADMVDGVHLAGLVQTSRTITAGTGITGGGDLTANRTISFDTTWGDGRYLGKTAQATDSAKLNGQSGSYYSRKLSASYSSVTGDDGTDGWYTLFSVSDASNSPILCHIRAYAHSSASFIVSKGYGTTGSTNAMISVLNANTSSVNVGYKYIKGLRVLLDGTTQVKLNGGASVQIDVQLFTSGNETVPAATLVKDVTASPSVGMTVDPLVNGSMVSLGDHYVGTNKVWHQGNDGTGSGLDADLFDGLDSGSFLRSDTTTTLSGGADLRLKAASASTDSGDLVFLAGDSTENARIYASPGQLSLSSGTNTGAQLILTDTLITYNGNTVWHASNDGSGSGLDADKLDGLESSAFVRTDADSTIAGNLIINSATDTRYLYISRLGTTTSQYARHGVNDTTYNLYYNNDDGIGYMKFTVDNTDTLSGGGANANTTVFQINGSKTTPSMTFNNNTVWHAGNDGSGSGLDADLLDGLDSLAFVKKDGTVAMTGNLTVPGIIANNGAYTVSSTLTDATNGSTWYGMGRSTLNLSGETSSTVQYAGYFGVNIKTGGHELIIPRTGSMTYDGNTVWHAGNDGSGSTLDADTVDGIQGVDILSTSSVYIGTQDWNTLTSNGIYRVGAFTGANTPTGAYDYGTLEVIVSSTSITQNYYSHSTGQNSGMWTRTKWNAADWVAWKKIWTNDNDGSGSGLDADLVDGLHASQFLRSDADDMMSGSITFGGTATVTDQHRGIYWDASDKETTTDFSDTAHIIHTVNSGGLTGSVLEIASNNDATDGVNFIVGSSASGVRINGNAIWHAGNDGSSSGLDSDLLDGLHGSSYMRTDANTSTSGTLTVSGALTASSSVDIAGVPSLTGWSGSYREGQKSNFVSRMNGRILNRNSDFIQNNTSGYGIYDNNSSGRLTFSIISDDTIPNNTGKLLRMNYDPARNATVLTSPNYGGFSIGYNRTTGNPTTWGYKAGNRYVHRIIAKIPVGRNIVFGSNLYGTGGGEKWLTSTAGTGNWQEYVMLHTIGNTGTFSTTGYWSISGGTDTAFTWDVSICQIIGIDEIPDVDRAPNLNVGYKATDVGWGEIYATGKIQSDSNVLGTNFVTTSTGGFYSNTSNSWLTPLNGSGNMHIKTGEGNKALYIDSDTFQVRDSAGTSRFSISSANNVTVTGATSFNNDVTVGGILNVNKTGNWSYIYFPKQVNDPGFIGHFEHSTDGHSEMRFSVSDDADGTDYFTFGANTGQAAGGYVVNTGTWTEGARIGSNGVATFKGLTVNGATTINNSASITGKLTLGTGNTNGISIDTATIQSVAAGELAIMTSQLRLGRVGAAWDYSKWAGFKYDDTLTTLYIGGPASANFKSSSTPVPRITVALEGTDAVTMDGKVTINPTNAASIGLTTMANAHLLLGTTTSGMALDTNEIMANGNAFYIGTIDSNSVNIAPNGTNRLVVSTSGISVTGTASVSGTSTLTGLVTASGGVNIPSGNSLYVGTNGSATAAFRFHYNGTDSYLDYNTDLHFRSGTTERNIMKADGKFGIGTTAPTYPLHVVGDIYATSWLRSGGNTGWFNETYAGGWYMTDTTWIRNYNGKGLYVSATTRVNDFQVGASTTYTAANDFLVSGSQLNYRNTLYATNTGVAVGKASLSNAAILDVYTSSTSGINLQRSVDTIAPGITFQNSDGVYTSWIAPTASASPDMVFYSEGNSTTLSTANIKETIRLTNAGNLQVAGDIYLKGGAGAQAIHGVNAISFDWTGAYDNAGNHGIQSHAEDGSQSDSLRINSFSSITMTIDTNANSTSYFKVQKESLTDGTDLLTLDENGQLGLAAGATLNGDASMVAADGRGMRFWNSDLYKVYMSDSTNGTFGGAVSTAATSDFNMYFRMTGGGVNRGFVFQTNSGKVAQIEDSGKVHANGGYRTKNYSMEYNTTEDSLDFIYWG
jgi:hypothetical protein